MDGWTGWMEWVDASQSTKENMTRAGVSCSAAPTSGAHDNGHNKMLAAIGPVYERGEYATFLSPGSLLLVAVQIGLQPLSHHRVPATFYPVLVKDFSVIACVAAPDCHNFLHRGKQGARLLQTMR